MTSPKHPAAAEEYLEDADSRSLLPGSRWLGAIAFLILVLAGHAITTRSANSRFVGVWQGTGPVPFEQTEYHFRADGTCTMLELGTGRTIGGPTHSLHWHVKGDLLVLWYLYPRPRDGRPISVRAREYLLNPLSFGQRTQRQKSPAYDFRILSGTEEEIALEVGRIPSAIPELRRKLVLRRVAPVAGSHEQ